MGAALATAVMVLQPSSPSTGQSHPVMGASTAAMGMVVEQALGGRGAITTGVQQRAAATAAAVGG